FLDVTENHFDMEFAMDIAQEIKDKIWKTTNLTASAGVSFNKFLAKIASDYNKPNGMYVITPKRAEQFIEGLKIERFFGIGKKTAEKMHKMGIFTGLDLKQKSEEFLIERSEERRVGKECKYEVRPYQQECKVEVSLI